MDQRYCEDCGEYVETTFKVTGCDPSHHEVYGDSVWEDGYDCCAQCGSPDLQHITCETEGCDEIPVCDDYCIACRIANDIEEGETPDLTPWNLDTTYYLLRHALGEAA